jgi:hypothetical protein
MKTDQSLHPHEPRRSAGSRDGIAFFKPVKPVKSVGPAAMIRYGGESEDTLREGRTG